MKYANGLNSLRKWTINSYHRRYPMCTRWHIPRCQNGLFQYFDQVSPWVNWLFHWILAKTSKKFDYWMTSLIAFAAASKCELFKENWKKTYMDKWESNFQLKTVLKSYERPNSDFELQKKIETQKCMQNLYLELRKDQRLYWKIDTDHPFPWLLWMLTPLAGHPDDRWSWNTLCRAIQGTEFVVCKTYRVKCPSFLKKLRFSIKLSFCVFFQVIFLKFTLAKIQFKFQGKIYFRFFSF